MPTIPVLPRPLGWLESRSTFASIFRGTPMVANTSIFNVTGHPALSIPGGVSAEGLPIGMQLVTRPGREGLLLALARPAREGRALADAAGPSDPASPPPRGGSLLASQPPVALRKTAFRSVGRYRTQRRRDCQHLPIAGERPEGNPAYTLRCRSADNFPERQTPWIPWILCRIDGEKFSAWNSIGKPSAGSMKMTVARGIRAHDRPKEGNRPAA